MRKILNSKIVHFISALMEWVIGIVLIILVVLALFQNVSKQGDFFGYRIYIVGSESMVPIYYVGDTLLVKEMPVENIDPGDTVTYVGEQEEIKDMIITHQLKSKEVDSNGEYLLHIKGIANDVEDPLVHESQLLGKVVYKFVILSFLGKIVTNTYLTITCITVPIVLLILIEIFKLLFKKDDSFFVEEEELNSKTSDTKKSKGIEDKNTLKDNVEDKNVAYKTGEGNVEKIQVGNEVLELPKKKTTKKKSTSSSKKKANATAVKIEEVEDLVEGKNK